MAVQQCLMDDILGRSELSPGLFTESTKQSYFIGSLLCYCHTQVLSTRTIQLPPATKGTLSSVRITTQFW